jgi:hypothetical protein
MNSEFFFFLTDMEFFEKFSVGCMIRGFWTSPPPLVSYCRRGAATAEQQLLENTSSSRSWKTKNFKMAANIFGPVAIFGILAVGSGG